jgi:hypothetical protein
MWRVIKTVAGMEHWTKDMSAAGSFTSGSFEPLHTLQKRCPQRSQTAVNLRVRFPHLQHFRVTLIRLRDFQLFPNEYNTCYLRGYSTLKCCQALLSRLRRPATNLKLSVLSPFSATRHSCSIYIKQAEFGFFSVRRTSCLTTKPAIASFISDLLREFGPATVEMFRGLW